MKSIFKILGELIEKSPFKTLFISLILFVLMFIGALSIDMATGSETLVKTSADAYKSNYAMEEEFGGDAIMILLEGEKGELLSLYNLEKLWRVEDRLKYNEDIFTFMSPSSVIHQITDKQGTEIKSQIPELSKGLKEISNKLRDISNELSSKNIPDPKKIDKKLNNLTNTLNINELMGDSLTKKENELKDNFNNLSSNLNEMGNKLNLIGQSMSDKELPDLTEASNQLEEITSNLSNLSLPPELSDLANILNNMKDIMSKDGISKDELDEISNGLITMGNQLSSVSSNIQDMGSESLIDPNELSSSFKSQIEKEISQIKNSLKMDIDPKEFKTMASGFITIADNLDKISDGLNTFNQKSGMFQASFPHNEKELNNILYEDNKLRDVFSDTIIDENSLMVMIKLKGNIDDSSIDSVYTAVEDAMDKENFDVKYTISGKPVLDSSLRDEMKSNMIVMVISAIFLMLIILNLVFKVRWRALSLGIIFISVIGTLGIMGHLSVSMTMVSMAVFPILIGLGIDYSIQLQNRYEEEKDVKITLTQIGRALGIAVIATILGFASLFISPVPMIADFGKMLTIGVIISFLGSIFLLMPILRSRDTVVTKAKDLKIKDYNKPGLIDNLFKKLVNFVIKLSPVIIIIAIILSGLGLVADSKVGVETDIETFMPQDMDALKDIHYIRDKVGSTNQMVLFIEDKDLLNEDNTKYIRELTNNIEDNYSNKISSIKYIDDLVNNFEDINDLSHKEYLNVINDKPVNQSKMFINETKDKSVVLMNVNHMSTLELEKFVKDINKEIKDSPINISITGKSVLDVEMVKGLTDGRLKMTILGLGLVFTALLILYRSFIKAAIAVLPVALIVGMSGGIMHILGLKYTPITATLGALVLGMGTEMTIMLLERYLEERKLGKNKEKALFTTMKYIGKATLASGLTTVGGFSVLMTSKFVILKDFGLMTVINISLAIYATFIILPALIWMLDKYIVKEN